MVKAAAGGGSTSAGIQVAKRVLADQVVMSVLFPSFFAWERWLMVKGTTWTDYVCWKYGFDGR
jgi:hypothetical protein